jgi:hypothetical protein
MMEPRKHPQASPLAVAVLSQESRPERATRRKKDHGPGAKIGGRGRRHDHATPLNPEAFERIQALRRRIYDSADYQEGIRSFFERRPPHFEGR